MKPGSFEIYLDDLIVFFFFFGGGQRGVKGKVELNNCKFLEGY